MQFLFTYGTLKDPQRLDTLLRHVSRWRSVGNASVQGRLYDTGEYPALVLSETPGDRVPGVLVQLEAPVPALTCLDAYEGVAQGLYERSQIVATLADGTSHACWVYVYRRPVDGLRRIQRW